MNARLAQEETNPITWEYVRLLSVQTQVSE